MAIASAAAAATSGAASTAGAAGAAGSAGLDSGRAAAAPSSPAGGSARDSEPKPAVGRAKGQGWHQPHSSSSAPPLNLISHPSESHRQSHSHFAHRTKPSPSHCPAAPSAPLAACTRRLPLAGSESIHRRGRHGLSRRCDAGFGGLKRHCKRRLLRRVGLQGLLCHRGALLAGSVRAGHGPRPRPCRCQEAGGWGGIGMGPGARLGNRTPAAR